MVWAFGLRKKKHPAGFWGSAELPPQDTGGVTEMEIGYLFARREWGKGYAAEAALACKEYGFKSLKYKKLVSIINVKKFCFYPCCGKKLA